MNKNKIGDILLEHTIPCIKDMILSYTTFQLIPNVDYDKSIKILKDIQAKFTKENSEMYNEKEVLDHKKHDEFNIIESRHKLSAITLCVADGDYYERHNDYPSSIFDLSIKDINSITDSVVSNCVINWNFVYSDVEKTDEVFVFRDDEKEFDATMYFSNYYWSDDNILTFRYIDKFHAWSVIVDSESDISETIIDDELIVILDFSKYY